MQRLLGLRLVSCSDRLYSERRRVCSHALGTDHSFTWMMKTLTSYAGYGREPHQRLVDARQQRAQQWLEAHPRLQRARQLWAVEHVSAAGRRGVEAVHPALRQPGQACEPSCHERCCADGSCMARLVLRGVLGLPDRCGGDPHLRLGDERCVLQELHLGWCVL
jgi:hypothetical protein